MKLVTGEEMRRLDGLASSRYGIAGLILMENAGLKVAEAAQGLSGRRGSCLILAGKGNNGGDGFVAARHLLNAGLEVKTFLLAPREEIRGDAAANLATLEKMGAKVYPLLEEKDLQRLNLALLSSDLVVDAIFGTGFKGGARGIPARTIEILNEAAKPVLAVDLPSGLEADSGRVMGPCVRATLTLTMGLPKPGLYLYPGAVYAGEVKVADISFPQALLKGGELRRELLEQHLVAGLLPRRQPWGHKGDYGHLLVVAGSLGMGGAAALAARGGLRAGAGLVTAAVPRSVQQAVAAAAPEVMVRPLPETGEGSLGAEALETLTELAGTCRSVALGPGLSRHSDTALLVHALLPLLKVPVVVDADGLNALAGGMDTLKETKAPLVLTPHPGEMAGLLKTTVAAVQDNRLGAAEEAAKRWGAVVALKGAATIVAAPDGHTYINPTGNPGLATAGTGDVLAGLIGGLLAQGLPPLEAAGAAVFLHGEAGDLAARELGQRGLVAGDLLTFLPKVLRQAEGAAAAAPGR